MRIIPTLGLILAATPAYAQTTEPPAATSNPAVDQAEEQSETLDERGASDSDILVVATKFGGQIEAPQAPIATFDEAEIQALGATSVGELIARVSPQTGSGRGRGEGGMPLILVNGQRITNFRELRNYPPEAIKRVEILPEEVALRFGSPPNTRVVNLILKDKFASRAVEASYSLPTAGGFNAWRGEATLLKISKLNRFTVTGTTSDTSPLFEDERDLVQAVGSIPTLVTDPDPATFRTLIADSRSFGLNSAWTKGFGKDGTKGALTISGEANRSDSRSFSGLNTVLLTAPGGTTALRSLPDPLERKTRTTNVQGGLGYNTMFGRWQFAATVDGTHAESSTLIDRRADTSALVTAAAAGTLPITGALPVLAPAGQDLATNNSERIESLVTVSGRPVRVPAGLIATTFKTGITWIDFDSLDQRSTSGPVSLNRFRVQAGVNVAVPITSRRENFGAGVGDITLNLSGNWSHLSDFGQVNDWSAGLTWAPTEKLNLGASYIVNQEAPAISQLGNPQAVTFNVPYYDFSRGETALVAVTSGGNPLLRREQQRDIKLSANWTLPFITNSNVVVEWFRNRSTDVTASFPLLTPEIEAAFPGRVTRDLTTGRLLAIDQRPVTFARQESSRLRWGFNLSGTIGKAPAGGGGMFGAGGGGGRPGGARPAGAAPAAAPTPAPPPPTAGAAPRIGGGPRRGGGGALAALGGGQQGRWSLGIYHTAQFQNRVLITPGGPALDLLNGDSLSTGGSPRHSLEFNGGVFHKGLGMFFQGSWSAPTTVEASGLPGTSDLRFGSVTSVNLFLFSEFSMMPKLTKKLPLLKGARMSLRIENLLGSVQKVTDGSGAVPISYQRDYLDPRGRVISIELRKSF